MRSMRRTFVIAGLVIALNSSSFAAVDAGIRMATLVSATGMVRIKESPAAQITAATIGMSLPEGAQVITLKDTHCQVKFDDGHYVMLAEATTLTLDRLPRRTGSVQTLLHLLRGKIRAMVDRSRGEGDFGCYGSTTVTAVKGTDYEMTRDEADETEVDVNEGKVNVAESKSEDPEEVGKVFQLALAGMIGMTLIENQMVHNNPRTHMSKPMDRPRPQRKPEAYGEKPRGGHEPGNKPAHEPRNGGGHEPGTKGERAPKGGKGGGGMPAMPGIGGGGFGGLP
jgi:hypothetical protein